jgi:FtsZ-binding cell division protein ZapB
MSNSQTKEQTFDLLVWDVEDIVNTNNKFSVKDDYEQLQYADKSIKNERREWYESFSLTN